MVIKNYPCRPSSRPSPALLEEWLHTSGAPRPEFEAAPGQLDRTLYARSAIEVLGQRGRGCFSQEVGDTFTFAPSEKRQILKYFNNQATRGNLDQEHTHLHHVDMEW